MDYKEELYSEDDEMYQAIYSNKIILNKYFIRLQKEFIEEQRDKYINEKKEKNTEKNIYDEYLDMFDKNFKKYENKKFFESLEITEEIKKSYLNIFEWVSTGMRGC